MNSEIQRYFREGKRKGISMDQLKDQLIEGGWSEQEIEKERLLFENVSKPKIKERPLGVKITAYLHYFAIPALVIISTIMNILQINAVQNTFSNLSAAASINNIFSFMPLINLIFIIIPIVVARNLWKGKNGDRIFAIIVAFIVLILNLRSVLSSVLAIPYVLIAGIVIYYLLIDKKTIAWFKKK